MKTLAILFSLHYVEVKSYFQRDNIMVGCVQFCQSPLFCYLNS